MWRPPSSRPSRSSRNSRPTFPAARARSPSCSPTRPPARWPRASACCAAIGNVAGRHHPLGPGIHRPDQQQGRASPPTAPSPPTRITASALCWAWTPARPATAGMAAPSPSIRGDVTQELPRATRTNTQWYMLTGYTDWRGKHVFLDTQISAAYGDFDETRSHQCRRRRSATPPAAGRAPCWRWAPIPA